MKRSVIKTLSVVAAITVLATGCKKDKDTTPAKELLISELEGSTFDYNTKGQLVRLGTINSFTNYFYKDDRVVVKTSYSDYVLRQIDSLYYDANGRVTKRESYENPTTKYSTALLSYNSDGTLGSILETIQGSGTIILAEYTYANGHLSRRQVSEDNGSGYKVVSEEDFLGIDDKVNPLIQAYNKCLIDEYNAVYLAAAGKHNPTSHKSVSYLPNGQVLSNNTTTITYEYNEQNMPTAYKLIVNGTPYTVPVNYIEK